MIKIDSFAVAGHTHYVTPGAKRAHSLPSATLASPRMRRDLTGQTLMPVTGSEQSCLKVTASAVRC